MEKKGDDRMASIVKRKKKYSVVYTYTDENGNGWSVGRLTANGLMGVCDIIPKSSAKPGDLIFFQGTYDTSGASHVGIYVGNGMMIHCGNPISYASIESNYW
jgi:cell wall-associated NlpC family hydrolase